MRFNLRSSRTSTNSCRRSLLPWWLSLAWVALLSLSSCKAKLEVEVAQGRKTSASATSLKPITAKPGDTVSLAGTGFYTKQKNLVKFTTASVATVSAPVTVTSDTEASFTMPEGVGLGLTSVVLESNGQQMTGPLSFVADLASNTLPILIVDQDQICSTMQYIDRNGDTQTGTKNCSGTTADLTSLTAANIRSGVTINGVTGTVTPAPANCSSAGQQSCVATGTYFAGTACTANSSACYLPTYAVSTQPLRAINYDTINSSAASIRSGTTLGGVAVSLADCSTDGATGCVTTASYKSANMANAIPNNIKNSVMIAGVTGALDSPDAWDLRVGVTVGAVTGKLKVNCRNRVRSAVYNYDGAVSLIPDTVVNSGTVIDYWDTIDDYNNNVSGPPTNIVPGWTNNDCGGVEASTGDDNVWKDITTTAGGAASTCSANSARCTMQDKISGLSWSKPIAALSWKSAINQCDDSTHNGRSDWRLPTQKELMDTYNHGFRSAANVIGTNWMDDVTLHSYFWSATSVSEDSSLSWYVYVAYGDTMYDSKNIPNQVICVR